jgi:uncharacterized protein (TIGR00369 family)
MLHAIPDGFEPLSMTGGLIEMLGPFYCKHASDDSLVFGLLSEPKHGNPNGIVHGATFVALIDTCMGSVIEHSTGRKCATIDLDTQFIAGGKIGNWIEARARVRKTTKTLAFLDGEILANGELLMTATAIFRVFSVDAAHGRT